MGPVNNSTHGSSTHVTLDARDVTLDARGVTRRSLRRAAPAGAGAAVSAIARRHAGDRHPTRLRPLTLLSSSATNSTLHTLRRTRPTSTMLKTTLLIVTFEMIRLAVQLVLGQQCDTRN